MLVIAGWVVNGQVGLNRIMLNALLLVLFIFQLDLQLQLLARPISQCHIVCANCIDSLTYRRIAKSNIHWIQCRLLFITYAMLYLKPAFNGFA